MARPAPPETPARHVRVTALACAGAAAATLGLTPRAVTSQRRRGWAPLGAPARDVAILQALHEGMYVPASFLSAQD